MTEPALVGGRWRLPTHFNFTTDVVERLAETPTRTAITFVDERRRVTNLSFGELVERTNRWANVLRRCGVTRGDRVLVLAGKSPEWHALMLAALKIGAVAIPCSDMLRARDLAFRVRHSGSRVVISERRAEDETERMLELVEERPRVIYLDEAERWLTLESASADGERTAVEEPSFILYTSGTTKDPKGVVHTHGYCFAKRMQADTWLDARPDDLVWCTASTGWAKSIWNVLLGPWSQGSTLVLHEGGFDPEERFELIAELGATVLCQAPTEYRLMAKLGNLSRFDLSSVRRAVSAGEPLNPEVMRSFRDHFGLQVYDGYGQTENTLLIGNFPGTEVRPGSMGVTSPGHDVGVVDDEGREVAAGVEGDVAVRGRPPTLFSAYHEQPEETARSFRGDWYVTGDRATRDDDGYFWFVGRADDVIISAAYRIGPFEVESALLEHAAVAESAVVGKPDPERGEIVKAFVVLRPGHDPDGALKLELQNHVKAVTAPYKYPREIEFVDELPKTRSGKIRRVELRNAERAAGRD